MKAGWQVRKFCEVCELKKGKKPVLISAPTNGYKPYLVAKYLRGAEPVEFASAADKNSIPVQEQEIIIICDGSNSGETFIGFDGILSSTMAKIVHGSDLDNKFLMYFLDSLFEKFNAAKTGSAIPHLDLVALREQTLPLPTLPEQQRIVGILDEAFDGIATAKANAEKNLQNARALFESHLQFVFTQRGEGWVEKTIGDVCDLLNGFAFKSSDTLPESETQLVRMGNLYGNKLDLDRSPVFYPDSFVVDYRRYILNDGDIIMSLTGTTGKEDYGYAVRIPECDHALLMNQRIAKFDSIREDFVNRSYLLHYLRSRAFLDILYPTANGTRQANLSSVTIKTLPIPLCSIREQNIIASSLESLLEETQRLESLCQRKLAALDELKKSLLHQAFSGML